MTIQRIGAFHVKSCFVEYVHDGCWRTAHANIMFVEVEHGKITCVTICAMMSFARPRNTFYHSRVEAHSQTPQHGNRTHSSLFSVPLPLPLLFAFAFATPLAAAAALALALAAALAGDILLELSQTTKHASPGHHHHAFA